MDLGTKIKDLRNQMGLTQEELAERADLTKGFISQIEHGSTSPSLDNLSKIIFALGTNLSDFFREEKEEQVVYKFENSFNRDDTENNSSLWWIIGDCQKNEMEPVIIELNPGGSSRKYTPFEGESYGYVLEGSIELHLGRNIYKLKKGDSFYFECSRKHYLTNVGKKNARVLWIKTPPNF